MQLLFLALVFVGMTRYADAFVVDDGNVDVYFIEFCLVFCFSFQVVLLVCESVDELARGWENE